MKAYEPELGKPFISPRAHDRSPFHATREDPLLPEDRPAFSDAGIHGPGLPAHEHSNGGDLVAGISGEVSPVNNAPRLKGTRNSTRILVELPYCNLCFCDALLSLSNALIEPFEYLGILLGPLGFGLQPVIEGLLGNLEFFLGSP